MTSSQIMNNLEIDASWKDDANEKLGALLRKVQQLCSRLDAVEAWVLNVNKQLRERYDMDKITGDQIRSIQKDIVWLLRRIERLEVVNGKAATPVEPAKIDLSKMVPGQYAKTRWGDRVLFIAAYKRQETTHYAFVNEIDFYFDCGVNGKHPTDKDYDIVEILPLEGE